MPPKKFAPPISLFDFIKKVQPLNPDASQSDIASAWSERYAADADPAELPTFSSFKEQMRPSNPNAPEVEIKSLWHAAYGNLGAKLEDPSVVERVGGTLAEGLISTGRTIKATGQAIIGDEAGAVATAKAQNEAKKDPALQSFIDDIAKRKAELGGDPSLVQSIGIFGKAAIKNPGGAGLMALEQIPNSGAVIASGGAGALAGSMVAPGVGTVVGGLAGLFIGNTTVETGSKVIEKASDSTFPPAEQREALREGAVKGLLVSLLDTATFGLSKWIMGTTARAMEKATQSVLTKEGIDIADHAAVKAATQNTEIAAKVIEAKATAKASVNTLAKKLVRGSGEIGFEVVGEGAGEYIGEFAATGKADTMEAVLEAFTSLGQSGAEIAIAQGWTKAQAARAQETAPAPAAEQPPTAPVTPPEPQPAATAAAPEAGLATPAPAPTPEAQAPLTQGVVQPDEISPKPTVPTQDAQPVTEAQTPAEAPAEAQTPAEAPAAPPSILDQTADDHQAITLDDAFSDQRIEHAQQNVSSAGEAGEIAAAPSETAPTSFVNPITGMEHESRSITASQIEGQPSIAREEPKVQATPEENAKVQQDLSTVQMPTTVAQPENIGKIPTEFDTNRGLPSRTQLDPAIPPHALDLGEPVMHMVAGGEQLSTLKTTGEITAITAATDTNDAIDAYKKANEVTPAILDQFIAGNAQTVSRAQDQISTSAKSFISPSLDPDVQVTKRYTQALVSALTPTNEPEKGITKFDVKDNGEMTYLGKPIRVVSPSELWDNSTPVETRKGMSKFAHDVMSVLSAVHGAELVVYNGDESFPDGFVPGDTNQKYVFVASDTDFHPVQIVGHEVTHLIEGTALYRSFAEVLHSSGLLSEDADILSARHQPDPENFLKEMLGDETAKANEKVEPEKLLHEIRSDIRGKAFMNQKVWDKAITYAAAELGTTQAWHQTTELMENLRDSIDQLSEEITKPSYPNYLKEPESQQIATEVAERLDDVHDMIAKSLARIFVSQPKEVISRLAAKIKKPSTTPETITETLPSVNPKVTGQVPLMSPKMLTEKHLIPISNADISSPLVQTKGKATKQTQAIRDLLYRTKVDLPVLVPNKHYQHETILAGSPVSKKTLESVGYKVQEAPKTDREKLEAGRVKPGQIREDATPIQLISTKDTEGEQSRVNKVIAELRAYTVTTGTGKNEELIAKLHATLVENLTWLHDVMSPKLRERAKLWYDGANIMTKQWSKIYGISHEKAAAVMAALSPQMDWFVNVSLAERAIDIMTKRENEYWTPEMTQWAKDYQAAKPLDQGRKDVLKIAKRSEGKTLNELPTKHAAVFLRVFDQTYHDPKYRLVTPEGGYLGFAELFVDNEQDLFKDAFRGYERIHWGSFRDIEKVVRVMRGEPIEHNLGDADKVNNFYANIITPNSEMGEVTIDTHAVAALLLRALSGNDEEVNTAWQRVGMYNLYSHAYHEAAKQRGIKPREMQSITWEAVRALFPSTIKAELKPRVDAIWKQYREGRRTLNETRQEIFLLSGGIKKFMWEDGGNGLFPENGGTTNDIVLPLNPGDRTAFPFYNSSKSRPKVEAQRVEQTPLFSEKERMNDGTNRTTAERTTSEPTAGKQSAAARGASELPGVPRRPYQEAGRAGTNLNGLPAVVDVNGQLTEFGGFKPAQDAAEAYMKEAGLPYTPETVYHKLDKTRATAIAQAYDALTHDPSDPETKAAYAAMIKEVIGQYRAIMKTGLKVEFIKGNDPYGNPRNAILDVVENNHFWVYGTREGFGSNEKFDPTASPMLGETNFTISGKTALVNDLFRVVHDYFGHIKEGVGFRAEGEDNAWYSHIAMFSPEAARAVTTETRGQNSWVNFGPFGEANRTASPADTHYADQKVGLMPAFASIRESKKMVLEHYSKLPNLKVIKPAKHGTGQAGAELRRKENAEPGTYVDRSYYYRAGSKPEDRFVKGHTKYTVTIDASRLVDMAGSTLDPTKREKQAKKDGFLGAFNSQGADPNAVMLFHNQPVDQPAQPKASAKPKNLKEFLKGSVVRKVVYHGTTRDFEQFHIPSNGQNNSLFGDWATKRYAAFFAADPLLATQFANQETGDSEAEIGQRIIPAYLSLKNPLDFTKGITDEQQRALVAAGMNERMAYQIATAHAEEAWEYFDEDQNGEETVKFMKAAGFDGAILEESFPGIENTKSYAVFSPEQAKSSTGNSGAFSKSTPDIRFSPKQITTPAFKQWFGDSKVVDANGKPLVMYHGSRHDFTVFDKEKIRKYDYDAEFNGFWFSSNPDTGPAFQDALHTKAVYLRMENPAPPEAWRKGTREASKRFKVNPSATRSEQDILRDVLQEQGYDGIYFEKPPQINKAELEKTGKASFLTARGYPYELRKEDVHGGYDLYETSGYPSHITGYESLEQFMDLQETTVVVFEPTQIKSAIANEGTFDNTNPDIRFSPKDGGITDEIFFSQLKRVIEKKMPAKASIEHVRGIIKGGLVKQDEIKWSGIESYLEAHKDDAIGLVNKADLLTWLKENQTTVTEVVKDRRPEEDNEQYPEVIPDGLTIEEENARQAEIDASAQLGTRHSNWTERGPMDNYTELLLTLPKNEGVFELTHHWSEENVVAHVRFDQREDQDAKSVLFIEEIQSDWHQKGRTQGYTNSSIKHALEKKVEAMRGEVNAALDKRDLLGFNDRSEALRAVIRHKDYADRWDVGAEYQPLFDAFRSAVNEHNNEVKKVPDAPFSKTWPELVLKRMIRWAADYGFDHLAWTTGDMQNARYSLINYIERVDAVKRGYGENKGRIKIHYWTKEGDGKELMVLPDKVEDYVGKELAAKILAQSTDETKSYKGLDLQVGGEGMKGFYDHILPMTIEKFLKPFNAKIETRQIELADGGEAAWSQTYTGPDITDEQVREFVKSLQYKNLGVQLQQQVRALWKNLQSDEPMPTKDYMQNNGSIALADLFGGNLVVHELRADNWREVQSITITPEMKAMAKGKMPLFAKKGVKKKVVPLFPPSANYTIPELSFMDATIRKLQDKNIDVARIVDAIKATGAVLPTGANPVLKEEMYHKRAEQMETDFNNQELIPLLNEMRMRGVTLKQLDDYMLARHVVADNVNARLATMNPKMPNNTALSGMTDADARKIYGSAQVPTMGPLALRVDAILKKSRDMMVMYGLEKASTIKEWEQTYLHYVPLRREGHEAEGFGSGQGRSVRSGTAKARLGSESGVTSILSNVAQARAQVITKGEKKEPVVAMAALMMLNINPELGQLAKPAPIRVINPNTGLPQIIPGDITLANGGKYSLPTIRYVDPKTKVVTVAPDPTYPSRPNVVLFPVKGETYAIVFNEDNPRAMEIAKAFKNIDTPPLTGIFAAVAPYTRYLAAVNTQYNPIFGVINFVRDVQFAMISMQSTPLAGKQADILAHTLTSMKEIYQDARLVRAGIIPNSPASQLWHQFQRVGGPTGYRDMFVNVSDRENSLQRLLNPKSWSQIKSPADFAHRVGDTKLFQWLSDYNTVMENAVRLGIFKTALDNGMEEIVAASLAKNATVNFNKKGQIGAQLGSLYAFFNANVQGTSRILETVFEPGKFGVLSDLGKKIVAGGILIGVLQAFVLALAGYDDDDVPEFIKQRALIIPFWTGKTFFSIPMPLGFNILPTVGRLAAEAVIGQITTGNAKSVDKGVKLLGAFVNSFNPVGGTGSLTQSMSPSVVDPVVALESNIDWTGKPIFKEDRDRLRPTPGYTRARDTATPWATFMAEAINYATGGNKYTAGAASPTPDSIDYVISQLTGGVGREVSKIAQLSTAAARGEAAPLHRVPLVGRFIGSATGPTAVREQFYVNIKNINVSYDEYIARSKNNDGADRFALSHPEAFLYKDVNAAETQLQKLKHYKADLLDRGASRDAVRLTETQINNTMEQINTKYREAVTRAKK